MRLALDVAVVLAALGSARAGPLDIEASPVASFRNFGGSTQFGPFAWRGGLSLHSANAEFGGLSGLALDKSCDRLIAVSDAGRWFTATLGYDGEGRLAAISEAQISPLLDDKGKPPPRKSKGDSEALASLGQGKYLVGFESVSRIGIYDVGKSGLKARFELLKSPKAITGGPRNGELESVGRFSGGPLKGHYIALSEKNHDAAGNIRGWAWKGSTTIAFSVLRLEDYDITDLAILPDGDVMILERSYAPGSLPGMAIRRFPASAITAGATVQPELLFKGRLPFYAIDNMEGIALCARDGETRVTIVSDNNFDTGLQRTLLVQFSYAP